MSTTSLGQGSEVEWVNKGGHQGLTPKASEQDLDRIAKAFESLPKPVVIHSSARVDRTGAAIRRIQQKSYPFHRQRPDPNAV